MKSIWITPLSVDDVNRRCQNTLSAHLGIEFIKVDHQSLTAKMEIDAKTMQPMGIMHGGSSAALAETVASAAANYCIDQTKYVCVGLDLNINHIRPVSRGFVEAVARPFHIGGKTQVWDIQIFDQEKRLVSVARLTLMVLTKE